MAIFIYDDPNKVNRNGRAINVVVYGKMFERVVLSDHF